MDALLLALVLTLLLDQSSGTQRLVARMADADTKESRRVVGLFLTIAINAVIAALMGVAMGALLMPPARLLFLAIALLFGAIGHLAAPFRTASPAPLFTASGPRALFGFALRRAGENSAFVTTGIAAFTDAPTLTVIGATVGGWVALAPALTWGTRYIRHGLVKFFLILNGVLLLCIAIGCVVEALRSSDRPVIAAVDHWQ